MEVLRSMYGISIFDVIDIYYLRWGFDKFFFGLWVNLLIGILSDDYVKFQIFVGCVFFVGEVIDELYNGYVYGGYFIGVNQVEKIVYCI